MECSLTLTDPDSNGGETLSPLGWYIADLQTLGLCREVRFVPIAEGPPLVWFVVIDAEWCIGSIQQCVGGKPGFMAVSSGEFRQCDTAVDAFAWVWSEYRTDESRANRWTRRGGVGFDLESMGV